MSFGTLFVTYPSGRMEVVELEKPTVSIGTALDNDVVLRDEAAEPFHVQVLCDPSGCQVLDLGGASGTHLQGAPLQPYLPEALADNDTFKIGAVVLTYCLPEPEEEEGTPQHRTRDRWLTRTGRAVTSYWKKKFGE